MRKLKDEISREFTEEKWDRFMKTIEEIEPQLELLVNINKYVPQVNDLRIAAYDPPVTYNIDKGAEKGLKALIKKYDGYIIGTYTGSEPPTIKMRIPFKNRKEFLTKLKTKNYIELIECYE